MSEDLTGILHQLDDTPEATEELLAAVYGELRASAGTQLRQERAGHTLLTTDLVHEAYLRLFEGNQPRFRDRRHFFATAALAMRRILVDHARRKTAGKRTDPFDGVPLADRPDMAGKLSLAEVLDLDRALEELERLDQRQCEIVLYRVFAGLTKKEIAEIMDLSERTIGREWFSARVWLTEQIGL
jgi:RNA polymerase sigma factor (TIGR02999 family)